MEGVLVHGSEVSGEYTDVTKSCWSRDEVQALVTLWANENIQDQLLSNVRNETVFTILAARLASLGFSKTPKRCREKIKKLKQEYKKIKDRKCTNHNGGIWFAIMDDVLNYHPDTLDSRMGDSTSLTPSMSTQATSFLDMEDNGKQRASWSPDEVVAFVRLWADQGVQEQLQSAVRNEKVFMKLSSELASLGFSKAPNRCREKIKKLKQEYKRINTMGGPNRRERRWFAIMDAVLSHQPGNGVHKVYNSATETLELIQPPSPSAFGLDHPDKCPSWLFADSQCVTGPRPAMSGFGSANSAAVGLESCLKEPILVLDCTGAVRERSSWSSDEVQDLLTLWADGSVQEKLLSTYRNESIFAKLCSELTLKGYDKTPNQCRQKIKKLKQEYKKIKDLGSSVHHKSRWFLIMDEVFSQQQDMILSEEMDSVQTSMGSSQPNSYMKQDSSEKSLSSWSPNEGPNVAIDQSATKSLDDGPLESADCSDKTQSIWAPDEVQIFLTLWADQSVQDQLLYTVRNTKVFTYLSIELASLGFNKTANQCRLKVKKLKQEYKKLKEMKGSKQRQSRWFAIMDQVLGQGAETEDSTTTPFESSVFALPEEDDRYCSSWSPNETQVLLTLWSDENIQEQLLSTVRNERVYSQLSSELASMGFHKTANQCRFKIKKLKQDYKKTLKQNGPKQRASRWFTIMDGVLGHRPETDVASNVIDSATNPCPSLPQDVEHFAPDFNFSTMCLLVPPIRLMTAFMWHVTRHRSIMHYERVEELVRLLTDLIPELLTSNQRIQLILGLRARLVLELCRGKGTADPVLIQPHLNMIFTLTKDFKREEDDVQLECLKSNFVEMVQTLLKDQSEKDIFFQELFPVYYGPRYDTALQTLVWELISRLDKLLPIPDVKKTGAWLSAAPSILDECGQMAFEPDQLKTLLEYHHRQGNLKCSNVSSYAGDTILSTLSLHPYSREQASIIGTDLNDLCRDNCVSYGSEQLLHGVKKDRPSDDSSEDKATAEGLSEEEWVAEHSSERNDKCLGFKQQLQKCLSPTKITGLRCQRSSRVHTCSLCPYSSNKMGLLQHIRKEHLQKASSDLGPEEPEQSKTVRLIAGITSRVYSCTRCCKVFKKLSLLNRHIGTHTLPFHCNQCEKRYSCKELLTKHQRVHTGERPFQCSHCGRGFMCSSTLKMHVRTHTGERRYKCHICGKTSIQHLARHMLMHKGEKNYLCTECGKAFLSSGELRLHTRYHTGERPYTCKHCGKGFIAKCHLTIHMRSHTGERPYLCSLCTKRFPTSNLLKRHMFVHNDRKPFQCFKCGKGFTQGHAMKTHLKTHK